MVGRIIPRAGSIILLLLGSDQVELFRDEINRGLNKETAKLMRLDGEAVMPLRRDFKHRFIWLATEAYRRELIGETKMCELTKMVDMSPEYIRRLIG